MRTHIERTPFDVRQSKDENGSGGCDRGGGGGGGAEMEAAAVAAAEEMEAVVVELAVVLEVDATARHSHVGSGRG